MIEGLIINNVIKELIIDSMIKGLIIDSDKGVNNR